MSHIPKQQKGQGSGCLVLMNTVVPDIVRPAKRLIRIRRALRQGQADVQFRQLARRHE